MGWEAIGIERDIADISIFDRCAVSLICFPSLVLQHLVIMPSQDDIPINMAL